MKYEYIDDITSDVKFRAYGNNLKELFENAALALANIFCESDKIQNRKTIEISVEGTDRSDLMVNWLTNIIAEVDIEEMFFCGFEIVEVSNTILRAKAFGDDISPELGGTVAKAVTNFNFELKETKEGFMVQVVIDI
ncbi:archease [Candidatus Woesearchaeota archaeon]|nr:archease [Candidatus Woesearchaeota archaeon]